MAIGARIEVEGLRELRRDLRRAGADAADLKGAGLEAARLVAARAEDRVPRRSGTLAGTIRPAGQQAAAVVRTGRASVPYAGPIHFGWRRHGIEPNPFLYDALDDRRREVIRVYEDELAKIARKVSA